MATDGRTTTSDGSATERVCAFISETTYDDIPDKVVDHATKMIVDSIGVTLAATETDATSIIRDVKDEKFGRRAASRVPGIGEGGSTDDVALLTGLMSHALDFDDVHHEMGGHPSTPVLAALLPVAERTDASGEDLLRSFVIGTDVEIRLANALNPGHYERGWHPTAVLGTLGAAAAVGDLLDLEEPRLRRALGIASSKAAGIKGNFGTMTKPLHVGEAARSGQEAAELAAGGFTANERILELDFGGFCDLFQGDMKYDLTEPFDKLGSKWGLLDPPVGFKPYPCCGSTHSAIDVANILRERHEPDPSSVESVLIEEHPRRLDHTDRPAPESSLDGKFSVQYCVTVALQEGDVWLDHFDDETVCTPSYQSFLEKIEVAADRNAFEDREWGARVTIETNTDRYIEEVDAPKGSAENPMSWSELEAKYRRCAAIRFTDDGVERSLETLRSLPEIDDVTVVLDDLT